TLRAGLPTRAGGTRSFDGIPATHGHEGAGDRPTGPAAHGGRASKARPGRSSNTQQLKVKEDGPVPATGGKGRPPSGPRAQHPRQAGGPSSPDRAAVPETESRSQALLTARAVEPGSAVEVTVFGQPHGQNRVKGVLQSLAAWHRERRTRGEKMEQLEAFLKARAPRPQPPAHPVA
uniref:KH-like RNA-binding domain-containing protein n=1 Tax=Equus caballus TaxID=9796 RepID=A0A9L0S6I4_HORSE